MRAISTMVKEKAPRGTLDALWLHSHWDVPLPFPYWANATLIVDFIDTFIRFDLLPMLELRPGFNLILTSKRHGGAFVQEWHP